MEVEKIMKISYFLEFKLIHFLLFKEFRIFFSCEVFTIDPRDR